jgi:hypothetical protein
VAGYYFYNKAFDIWRDEKGQEFDKLYHDAGHGYTDRDFSLCHYAKDRSLYYYFFLFEKLEPYCSFFNPKTAKMD